ncbi:diacylglycerol/lipid kinase family protein [Terricaulis sp.]|uniref:diacylglycerol/lipid kinase family protein n=1 Tax=Terricaulis sp. TaxID=2768686 RepID=UPI0037850B7D
MEQAIETSVAPGEPGAPKQSAYKRALILFNEKAGSVRSGDRDKLIAAVQAAGVEQYALVGPEMTSANLFKLAKDFDVLIVLGGDGTARNVAEFAPANAPPLMLLPGGTLNVLPRALYGERAWPEALKDGLEQGVVKRLPAGKANGAPFFVAAIFGEPTLLARAREAVREGQFLRAFRRFNHFTRRAFTHRVRARAQGHPMQKVAAVGVLCPAFSGEVEGKELEWVTLDASRLLDLARVSLRSMSNAWRDDPAIEIGQCKSGEISSPGLIPATLDGEPKTFVSSIKITYSPNGPRVLALEDKAV